MACISGLPYTGILTGKSGTERLEIHDDVEQENCSPQCCSTLNSTGLPKSTCHMQTWQHCSKDCTVSIGVNQALLPPTYKP